MSHFEQDIGCDFCAEIDPAGGQPAQNAYNTIIKKIYKHDGGHVIVFGYLVSI